MSSVPLTQAVTSGDADAVNTVLANGADVNERTGGGQTPIILATIFGHTHLVPLLLQAGADPQLRDNLGLNAIDWAQRRGATEVIDVLNGKTAAASRFPTSAPKRPTGPARSPEAEKPKPVSEAERSRRWIEGLKQRIAEQSHTEIPDGPNIFRPRRETIAETQRQFLATDREPTPEIPVTPAPQPESPAPRAPQPEIPALPTEPEPEIPALPPEPELPPETPKPELPGGPPTPELPGEPPIQEPPIEGKAARNIASATNVAASANVAPPANVAAPTNVARPTNVAPPANVAPSTNVAPATNASATDLIGSRNVAASQNVAPATNVAPSTDVAAEEKTPGSATRKRCPQCNAIYHSDLVAYCAHHVVALVDDDETPMISEPPKASPVMFWMIIVITLTGSIVVGSLITAYFYTSNPAPQVAAPPGPAPVQKGTPALDETLEGKATSLPIAECPLNGQEAIPGTVVVRVLIDKSGQVKEAQASGGDWLLRGAASEAAMKSTFAPEKLRARETEGTITYTFEP